MLMEILPDAKMTAQASIATALGTILPALKKFISEDPRVVAP
jgi:hypothetical protein